MTTYFDRIFYNDNYSVSTNAGFYFDRLNVKLDEVSGETQRNASETGVYMTNTNTQT